MENINLTTWHNFLFETCCIYVILIRVHFEVTVKQSHKHDLSYCWVGFGCGLWALNSMSGICVVSFHCLAVVLLETLKSGPELIPCARAAFLKPLSSLLPKITWNRSSEQFPFMFFPNYPFCSQHRREVIWFRELAKFPDSVLNFLLFLFPFCGVTTDIICFSAMVMALCALPYVWTYELLCYTDGSF